MTSLATSKRAVIRRNVDGNYNLSDLRRAVDASPDILLGGSPGSYIMLRYDGVRGMWIETATHMLDSEHDVLCRILRIA